MNEIVTPEAEATVEYGGLVWIKSVRGDTPEYEVTQPDCGSYRISQYTDQDRWFWGVVFDSLVDREQFPRTLRMETSGIKETRADAMQACMEAKGKFIADIKQVCAELGIGDYADGYTDGKSDLLKKIAEVLS